MRKSSFWLAALSIALFAAFLGAQDYQRGGTFNPTRDVEFTGLLVIPRADSPAQEIDGALVWDGDGDLLTIGTGSGRKTAVDTNSTQTLTNKTLTSPTLTTPAIGAATGTSLAATGTITSSSASAGIGYATGAGCSVTQATSRTTGVTCTGVSGAITTDATSLAAGAEAEFTVTNTSVAVGDVVVVAARSGMTAGTSIPVVTTVAAGSFKITLTNLHAATADTGAMIINFAVIKAVSS